MIDEFQLMREIIGGYIQQEENVFKGSCYRRLYSILSGESKAGPGDIASLVRQVLRGEEERQGGTAQTLLVPAVPPWPAPSEWARAGIDILDQRGDALLIQARGWAPHWLPLDGDQSVERPLFALDRRRNYSPAPEDPFLSEMGLENYLCPGQREAVRSVLTAPPGATLIVNLPTGSGKSLCAQLPGLLYSGSGGLTVVVVPTTALCIDQERSLEPFIEHPTAYYSGTSAGARERNAGIRERISNGTQRIIFTSPESLGQSLAGPIYAAAGRGYLKLLVIDEAHIVDQWGDEFRSSFQEVAGIRKDLLRICPGKPFPTLLLSATITETCLDTLETLFGTPGPLAMVSAVQLRPEPSYWFAHCPNLEVKAQRVLEAVHHLPRPLILYTTRVDEANAWTEVLKGMGYLRCEVVTGKTVAEERLSIVRRWQEQQIDIIVATSAFGLGVDLAEVRSVVHACVPESVDRYYQEVGRGGRDGYATLSLAIYTDEDLKVARSMSKRIIISIERGLQRWRRMFENMESLGQGRYRVPVDVTPSNDQGDIDMENELNLAWNVRTLTLMSRAGLIELDAEIPPRWDQAKCGTSTEKLAQTFQETLQSHSNTRVVSIINEQHLDLQTWQQTVEPARQKTNAFTKNTMRLMEELLQGDGCVADVFADIYTIRKRNHQPALRPVTVSKSCGGCPRCRRNGISPFVGIVPAPPPVWPPLLELGGELRRLMGGGEILAIFYGSLAMEDRRDFRRWNTLVSWLISQGMRNLVAPDELLQKLGPATKKVPGAFVFFSQEFRPLFMPRVPTLVIHLEDLPVPENYHRPGANPAPPRVLLLPTAATNPAKSHCLLMDTITCRKFSLEEFFTEVGL